MKTIGIFNPSSPSYDPVDMDKICAFFRGKGFAVKQSPHLWEYDRFLNGSDAQRAQDIMTLFCDKEVDILLALRGGYGSGRVLDLLDFDLIKANKKTVIGFSDTTALQLGLWAKAGVPCLTGLSPKRDIACVEKVDLIIEKTFDLAIKGTSLSVDLEPMNENLCAVKGALLGGTLCLVDELIGTPYCPKLEGAILFLEEVMEEPYKIDRMLTHLRLAGVFEQVSGVIWGDFYKCLSEDENDGTIAEVLQDLHQRCPHLPMWRGLNYGHSDSRMVLPIGAKANIQNNILSFEYRWDTNRT